MAEFTAGDVVKLKSGGPQMTVEGTDSDSVECVFFDKDNVLKRATFAKDTVQIFKPSSGTTFMSV